MGVTIKDIAEKANVSATTVSRVINDKPDVSPETKQKIIKIINEMGYNPNAIARGLVLSKTYTLGLIIPDISNPFFPEVARGIETEARKGGYSVIFCSTYNNRREEKDAIELLKSKQVDGIILSLSIDSSRELEELYREGYPVVQIDRKVPGSSFPTVSINNIESAYQATEHLIKLGHTAIAHITGDLATKTGQDRLKGFKKALTDHNLSPHEEWIVEGDYGKDSGYRGMKKLLQSGRKPTAVFAANDLMALGAYRAVFAEGLSIPADISLVGHDDIDLSAIVNPGLTTMTLPKRKFGRRAARILIDEIERGEIFANSEDIILTTELVARQSTKELMA